MEIVNEPVSIDFDFYNKQIDEYVSRVKEVPGVCSIYLMGSINAPGLSDIDVLVVVSDDFDRDNSKALSVLDLDSRVFLHGPIIIPKSLSQKVQYIFYASNLSCIYGDECLQAWEDLRAGERKKLAACYLIDFIESRFMQFSSIGCSKIDKRAWLTRIWSTVHSLELYQCAFENGVPERVSSLAELVKRTRSDWLEFGVVKEKVFLDGLKASAEINEFIFFNALERLYGCPIINGKFRIVSGSRSIKFHNNMQGKKKYYLAGYKLLNKHLNIFVAEHGPSYLAHLEHYSDIKIGWHYFPRKNEELERVKFKRKEIVACHNFWINSHAPKSGSMRGYLGVDNGLALGLKGRIKSVLSYLVF
ncbi:hypothetical protein [Marinobacter sp.]|uniref:hypothetical protein n=1 Tax=Marinobacter sp. TaxID=50741 RepID=UPI003BA96992